MSDFGVTVATTPRFETLGEMDSRWKAGARVCEERAKIAESRDRTASDFPCIADASKSRGTKTRGVTFREPGVATVRLGFPGGIQSGDGRFSGLPDCFYFPTS